MIYTDEKVKRNIDLWLRTKGGYSLVVDLVEKRKEAARVRKIVDAYQLPIFKRFKFPTKIKNPKALYLLDEEYDNLVAEFYQACEVAHKENGFNVKPGYCPALVAENEAIQAERPLLEGYARETGLNPDFVLANRKRDDILNLFIKLLESSL